MEHLIQSYSRYLRTVGYQQSTQKMLVYGLKEFLEKHPELERVNREEIKRYAKYLSTRPKKNGKGGLSSSMVRHYLWGLKNFFGWCEQTERINLNPMSGYVLPEVENMRRSILTKREIQSVYEVCETHQDRALLGMFYGCGLRRSEGEKLNGNDIDFKEGLLYVRSGKGGKRRVIPLSEKVRRDFVNYYREERGNHPVSSSFILNENERRMRGNSYNQRIKKLVSKSGILKQITLHSLRHSIATHLLSEGLSLEQVRDFLGHAHLETTQIYTHDTTSKVFKR